MSEHFLNNEEAFERAENVLAKLCGNDEVKLGQFLDLENNHAVDLLLDLEEDCAQTNIPLRPVSRKILSRVLKEVAMEEYPDFRSYWKNILFSAIEGEGLDHFHDYFIHLLKNLSAISLPVLKLLLNYSFQSHSEELAILNDRFISSQTGINQNVLEIVYGQLTQLNLVEWVEVEPTEHQPNPESGLILTRLGVAFLRVILPTS